MLTNKAVMSQGTPVRRFKNGGLILGAFIENCLAAELAVVFTF
jgi:hypothetical protein